MPFTDAVRQRLIVLLTACAALLAAAASAHAAPPPVKHVWVIQLENKAFDETFLQSAEHVYLWKTLPESGALLRQYYGTGHASLDNYITQISGQAPNAITQSDCLLYIDVVPGIVGADGQALGQGCVYPKQVRTLVDQLEERGLTWKGYMEDLGNDPARESARCGAPQLGKVDPTQSATATDQYAARHNPFVYFHSILDVPGRCEAHVGPLPPLADDLKTVASTPNFSWITPNLCNDGHDATPCKGVNAKGTKEGDLIAADAFLAKWVPTILRSPAFKQDGMLLITFDESQIGDALACCNEPAGLNTLAPGIVGPGGGRTGAVVLSPFVRPGTISDTQYNHYSLLKSLEQVFGIDEHLGYANLPGTSSFGDDLYTRPGGGPVPAPDPLHPQDAGSTGVAQPLRLRARLTRAAPTRLATLRSRLAAGLGVRLTVTGSDRALNGVRARLVRVVGTGRGQRTRTVASASRSSLRGGRGTLRIRAGARVRRGLTAGRYVLVAEVVHEGDVLRRARVALRVR